MVYKVYSLSWLEYFEVKHEEEEVILYTSTQPIPIGTFQCMFLQLV
jgi:hypothetical protein